MEAPVCSLPRTNKITSRREMYLLSVEKQNTYVVIKTNSTSLIILVSDNFFVESKCVVFLCFFFCKIRYVPSFLWKCLYQVRVIAVFPVFRLLTDFACLLTYEFCLSLWKIARCSVILLLSLFTKTKYLNLRWSFFLINTCGLIL